MSDIDDILRPLLRSGRDIFWQGMTTEAAVADVESLLGVKFPPSYRSFLLKYGGGGVEGEEISGVERSNPSLENRGTVLGDTKRCRAEFALPHQLIVIYFQNDEVCWCIDCSRPDALGENRVVSYSVFAHRIDAVIGANFLDFLRDYVGLRCVGGA